MLCLKNTEAAILTFIFRIFRKFSVTNDPGSRSCRGQKSGFVYLIAKDASSSVATRMIIGKTLEEACKITNQDVLNELGGEMPASKIHCSILAEEAIRAAVDNYHMKQERGDKATDSDDEE